jgi:hypothetical protein
VLSWCRCLDNSLEAIGKDKNNRLSFAYFAEQDGAGERCLSVDEDGPLRVAPIAFQGSLEPFEGQGLRCSLSLAAGPSIDHPHIHRDNQPASVG